MIGEIKPNLHRIEIPLPNNPLGTLNPYVVKGKGRSLIIDTGMNRDGCFHPMLTGLDRLNVDLNETDLFITHCTQITQVRFSDMGPMENCPKDFQNLLAIRQSRYQDLPSRLFLMEYIRDF